MNIAQTNCPSSAPCPSTGCTCPLDLTNSTGVLINYFTGYQCAYPGGACTWDSVSTTELDVSYDLLTFSVCSPVPSPMCARATAPPPQLATRSATSPLLPSTTHPLPTPDSHLSLGSLASQVYSVCPDSPACSSGTLGSKSNEVLRGSLGLCTLEQSSNFFLCLVVALLGLCV